MSKYIYPAVFTKEDNNLYSVSFPDIEGCFTQGSGIQDSIEMAQDVLSIILCDMEDDKKVIPPASDPLDIKLGENSFVSLVSADTLEYRKIYNGKAVKKTLTIPQWLNEAAEKENVNFSQTLKNALIKQLNIK